MKFYEFSNELTQQLVEILKRENPTGDYRVSRSLSGNLMIEESEEGSQLLYLRPFPKETLTIARIKTLKTRSGMGRAIFECLEHYAKQQNCTQLVIEQVMTPDMIRFAEKESFVWDESSGMFFEGMKLGNYVKKI